MLTKLMNTLVLSCKEATELVEKREVTALTSRQRLQLKIHLWICSACRSYAKQSHLMNKMLERFVTSSTEEIHCMDDTSKAKILRHIKNTD